MVVDWLATAWAASHRHHEIGSTHHSISLRFGHSAMTMKPNGYRCEACGGPATRMTADDVPLCEGDYQHILEHWIAEEAKQKAPAD